MSVKQQVMCDRKIAHSSRTEALDHLHSLARRGAFIRGLRVYRCPFCRAWHVGHKMRGPR